MVTRRLTHWLPGARGFAPSVLLPSATAWTDESAVGLSGAPASIPKRLGRAARFTRVSAASRIESRIDPLHCTPRRYISVGKTRDWSRLPRVEVFTRIVGHLSPCLLRQPPRNSRWGR